ncbi:MAG TPA: phosphatase PAP2 family protein [Acidobacteriaceae bacterium]|jgi:membrane-associated phospholipid phosphatase|nr:phosphatase PAP2 family protein [Acidobacteriaceae bacterium]
MSFRSDASRRVAGASPWKSSPAARRFNVVMGGIAALLTPADILLGRHVHVTHSGIGSIVWLVLLMFGALLVYCRWRPLPRLIESIEIAIWAVFFTNTLSVLIQIAGRSQYPLIDRQLSRMDARVHFSTAAAMHLAMRMPGVGHALAILYALVAVFLLAAILLLPFLGYGDASRQYVMGIVFAALITAGVFALLPAAGPWTTEGFAPSRDQAAVTSYLTLLKSGAPAALNMKQAAVVAFPSFHVLLALLSAVALSSIRRLRAVVWALAILMCLSTLTTGWHYLTDVAGGVALTLVTLLAVRAVLPSRTIQYREFQPAPAAMPELTDAEAALPQG